MENLNPNFLLEKEPKKEKHVFSNLGSQEDGQSKNNFKIKVVGIGGAGCNVINYIYTYRPDLKQACDLYALNTDMGPFKLMDQSANLFILDKEELKGYGSGGKPEIGAKAVLHDKEIIKQELADTDILFIIAGLGKGTGSGGAPEIAKIAKELNILTVGIVNMPSIAAEGNVIFNNAFASLQQLANVVDSLTTISNEKIIHNKKDISFYDAYNYANSQISMIINQIVNIIFKPSQINLDFSDLRSFFKKNKYFMASSIKVANSNVSENEINRLIKASVSTNICDVNIAKAKEAIANLVLSKKTNTNIIISIKNALGLVTENELINLVSGIDYHDEDSLVITYLISGGSFMPQFDVSEPVEEQAQVQSTSFEDYDALLKDIEQASTPTQDIEYIEQETKDIE